MATEKGFRWIMGYKQFWIVKAHQDEGNVKMSRQRLT